MTHIDTPNNWPPKKQKTERREKNSQENLPRLVDPPGCLPRSASDRWGILGRDHDITHPTPLQPWSSHNRPLSRFLGRLRAKRALRPITPFGASHSAWGAGLAFVQGSEASWAIALARMRPAAT